MLTHEVIGERLVLCGEVMLESLDSVVGPTSPLVEAGAVTTFDLSAVTALDTAGLQWLMWCVEVGARRGRAVEVTGATAPVEATLKFATWRRP